MMQEQSGIYRRRRYRVLYIGDTRYGRRAKLANMLGRSEFWVDADAVSELRPGPQCEMCGLLDALTVQPGSYGLLCRSCYEECESGVDRRPVAVVDWVTALLDAVQRRLHDLLQYLLL